MYSTRKGRIFLLYMQIFVQIFFVFFLSQPFLDEKTQTTIHTKHTFTPFFYSFFIRDSCHVHHGFF